MNFGEFKLLVTNLRAVRPELFFTEFWDRAASAIQIELASKSLGCQFPPEYASYVQEYGGGDALGTRIYSCDADSNLYIVSKNRELEGWLPRKLIAFSDNGCGDYYVFRLMKGRCAPEVYLFRHDEMSLSEAKAENILEFIMKNVSDSR